MSLLQAQSTREVHRNSQIDFSFYFSNGLINTSLKDMQVHHYAFQLLIISFCKYDYFFILISTIFYQHAQRIFKNTYVPKFKSTGTAKCNNQR